MFKGKTYFFKKGPSFHPLNLIEKIFSNMSKPTSFSMTTTFYSEHQDLSPWCTLHKKWNFPSARNCGFGRIYWLSLLYPTFFVYHSTVQKWSFPLRISSVNVAKSAGNCRLGYITEYSEKELLENFWERIKTRN